MVREYSKDPKRIRQRLRAGAKLMARDVDALYNKPLSQWDFEELSRGKPKDPQGNFYGGPKPKWINEVIQVEIYNRLKSATRGEMNVHTGTAIQTIVEIMKDDREDENGRPLTPSSVKLDAAKYLLDHLIGKATSKVEITGKLDLQHFLAGVMVNPDGDDAHPTTIEGSVEGSIVEELNYEGDEDDDE